MRRRTSSFWSVLGKHTSRGDFVRLNAGSEAAVAFHRFLEAGVDWLHRQRQTIGTEPIRFVFRSGDSALVGVMIASQDVSGRSFPLATFVELDREDLPPTEALASLAQGPLSEAETMMLLHAGSTEPLDAAVAALPDVDPGELRAAAVSDAERINGHVRIADLHALFEAGPAGGAWYGVHTVMLAGEARRRTLKDAPTLECPLSTAFGASAWLAIAAKADPNGPAPSLFWNASRLYVALGNPPVAMFSGLAGGEISSNRVWPVTTTQPPAIASAKSALVGGAVLDRPEALLDAALATLGDKR